MLKTSFLTRLSENFPTIVVIKDNKIESSSSDRNDETVKISVKSKKYKKICKI